MQPWPSVHRAGKRDVEAIHRLVSEVFLEYVAPGYSRSGVAKFRRDVTQASLAGALEHGDPILMASVEGSLVGMLQVRTNGHIPLFFVRRGFQRRGIGRALISHAIDWCLQLDPAITHITVNSSPNALDAYSRLGFIPAGAQGDAEGLLYNPMALALETLPADR